MSLLDGLLADLEAECTALDLIVGRLDPPRWATATPADGWDIRDQIWHLSWYDGASYRAMAAPEAYAKEWAGVFRDINGYADDVVRKGRELAPEAVRAAWREQSGLLRRAALAAGPRTRVDWHDTTMSVASMVTARIQETWAHGQDVRDAVGLPPESSDRLRHVAHIGCGALPYAFHAHGKQPPAEAVRVELELPSGELFAYGPQHAANRVSGRALDFCLAVTQRRHLSDVTLDIAGPVAAQWMPIAQSFAGPPGPGRAPGQFPPGQSQQNTGQQNTGQQNTGQQSAQGGGHRG
jgi:uncharacterized protein (TIGR03084 family)